jgi:hypothetical protein
MVPAYKRKSIIAALIYAASIGPLLWWTQHHPGGNIWDDGDVVGITLMVVMCGSGLYALYALVRAKARDPAWLLVLLLHLLGIIILLALKDRSGEPKALPEGPESSA